MLREEPYRFELYQAIRLLELMAPERRPVGSSSLVRREAVRFSGSTRLSFPTSDIERLDPSDDPRDPMVMKVTAFTLAGAHGPLPPPYAELVEHRVRAKDTGIAAFLDIFNHRLISILHRVRRLHRPELMNQPAEETHFSRVLFSAFGMGLTGMRDRLRVPDPALLRYAGLLAHQPHSAMALERVIGGLFGVPARVEQLVGMWIAIDRRQQTIVGRRRRQNNRLGSTSVVGTRFWSQSNAIGLVLGPLPLATFREYLPTGGLFRRVASILRFYLDRTIQTELRLLVKGADVGPLTLSRKAPPQLGWTTWLAHDATRHGDAMSRVRMVQYLKM
ncbi:type VI secretion system baseplate subunit TssG [Marinibaculum pumilum]|uniref:Type VI secretion system baseplate subunit TssG n=1 Tax=Marinibaculum pumilum TaxID=1766165 RepID=A0ABV7L4B5_9PROT